MLLDLFSSPTPGFGSIFIFMNVVFFSHMFSLQKLLGVLGISRREADCPETQESPLLQASGCSSLGGAGHYLLYLWEGEWMSQMVLDSKSHLLLDHP